MAEDEARRAAAQTARVCIFVLGGVGNPPPIALKDAIEKLEGLVKETCTHIVVLTPPGRFEAVSRLLPGATVIPCNVAKREVAAFTTAAVTGAVCEEYNYCKVYIVGIDANLESLAAAAAAASVIATNGYSKFNPERVGIYVYKYATRVVKPLVGQKKLVEDVLRYTHLSRLIDAIADAARYIGRGVIFYLYEEALEPQLMIDAIKKALYRYAAETGKWHLVRDEHVYDHSLDILYRILTALADAGVYKAVAGPWYQPTRPKLPSQHPNPERQLSVYVLRA